MRSTIRNFLATGLLIGTHEAMTGKPVYGWSCAVEQTNCELENGYICGADFHVFPPPDIIIDCCDRTTRLWSWSIMCQT